MNLKKKVVLTAVALFASSGVGLSNVSRVIAAPSTVNSSEPEKQISITVTYVDTENHVVSSKVHQFTAGDTLSQWTFNSDFYSPDNSTQYDTLLNSPDNHAYTNVQDLQKFTFYVGKKLNVQFVYVDLAGKEVGREKHEETATDQIEPGMLHIPAGYDIAKSSLQTTLKFVNPNFSNLGFKGVETEGPFNVVVGKRLSVKVNYVDSEGQNVGSNAFDAIQGDSSSEHDDNEWEPVAAPDGYHFAPDSEQPGKVSPNKYVFMSDVPVNFKVVKNADSVNPVTPVTPVAPVYPAYPQEPTTSPEIDDYSGVVTVFANDGALVYSDDNLSQASSKTLVKGTQWQAFGIKKTKGNVIAYNLGGNQWVNASDVLISKSAPDPVPAPSSPSTNQIVGVFTVNVPNHTKWATVVWDRFGKPTSEFLAAGTRWKVSAKKTVNGQDYYCLGSNDQWVSAKYGSLN